ncbi:MAG: N-acyl-D-amino-acid deacylase family protein [Acidobacteriaceae bacterium]
MRRRLQASWLSRILFGLAILAIPLPLAAVGKAVAQAPEFDIVIRHGRIVDGSGNPWYRGDVGIRGKAIVAIGDLSYAVARRTIDAHDHIVAPGFIETMGWNSYILIEDPVSVESKLQQGCTTMLVGEGISEAPQSDATAKQIEARDPEAKVTWRNFAQYFQLLTQHGIGMNVVHDVGAAQVREVVMGDTDRDPTPEELEKMKALVAEAMQQGAVGLSSALIYPPGSYAKTPELIALAKVAAQYHGTYFTHMRSESGGLLAAIDEAISIGEQAKIPVHIYHLKAAGAENWHLIGPALQRIQAARDRGIDVTANAYPYIYNGLDLGSFIPPDAYAEGRKRLIQSLTSPATRRKLEQEIKTRTDWENWYLHADGDWSNVLLSTDAGWEMTVPGRINASEGGLTLHQAAVLEKKDDWTEFFDLVQRGDPVVAVRSMNEEQKDAIYREPWVSISSDAPPADPARDAHVHPRTFGTFPRIYAKYVRAEHVLTLEDAVRKMTSLPANLMGLYDRGRIAPGMAADIVIFDLDKIQDTATYAQPAVYPTGIDMVLVNGTVAVDHGTSTGELAGEVLAHSYPRTKSDQ